jgi:hypothetical protein
MIRAICPYCGNQLEPPPSDIRLGPSCSVCEWSSSSRRSGRKGQLRATSDVSGSPTRASDAFMKLIPSPEIAQSLFAPILKLQKPRSLKRDPGVMRSFILVGVVVAMTAWLVNKGPAGIALDFTGAPYLFIFMIAAMWALTIMYITILLDSTKRNLLREGEVTIGRVVCQGRTASAPKQSSISIIYYAFVDNGNRAFIGRGRDYSDNIAEGAPVVVFYEPLDPSQNVALEGCNQTLLLPRD